VICPNCREDNAPTFRFCGMCGTSLEPRVEARRPAGAPVPILPPNLPKIAHAPEPMRPVVMENATKPSNSPQSSLGGPSVLGLDQPGGNQPSTDVLRERAFSGLDSFFEPEQPKTSGRRILLMVALLAALGGAAWWTYTNYLGATEGRKPEPATSNADEASAEKPSTHAAGTQDAAPAAGSPQAAVPSAAVPSAAAIPGGRVPESQTENASAGPDATRKTAEAEAKPAAETKPMTPAPVSQPKTRPADRRAATREPGVTSAKASKSPTPATADTGDPDFRKGEAYLYGRGAQENCNEAVRYLKAASAKSNAKARSAFGTMYATGHCVQRDLPTSYLWFALALRVDPNNQILEKDLNAVWNQMTPPERQMATRMKQ
jgi:hypothetical protein